MWGILVLQLVGKFDSLEVLVQQHAHIDVYDTLSEGLIPLCAE